MGKNKGTALNLIIRNMSKDDWKHVSKIYLEGIKTGNATFEKEVPNWQVWDTSHLSHSRILALEKTTILGWAALSQITDRCVYSGVAELSIYISVNAIGKGVGKFLLKALIKESEVNGIWTIQAGVFPENTASIHLLKSCGFREIGYRERLGKLGDTWRDVLLFEHRSLNVGK